MAKRILIFIAASFLVFNIYAQHPEKTLKQWAEQNPVEKVYFHFDRNDYLPGQIIWFKGYLYADFLPADNSTTLFVELLNTSSRVISRQAFPVFMGFTRGQIGLPDTLPGGIYMIRAYTAAMLYQNPDFLYKKLFFISGKNKTSRAVEDKTPMIRLEFFPEGGNFITGLSNSIAFRASNEKGLPVPVSGVIKNENGEKIAGLSSYHDGMGYFDITAKENSNYYAVLDNDPSGQKYFLPSQTPKGVVLRIISSGKTKMYEVLQRHDNPVFRAAYMIGQMQHHVVFKKEFKEEKDEMTGMIQTANLSSGILHITVFNKEGMPLAERLTFVDNKEYIQPGDVLPDTVNLSDRGLNHFTLSLKDTVRGSFSVSVYDHAFDPESSRAENIFSGLLLTSDLKGYIHDPAYYFSGNNEDSVQNALDLVMMTNGWRRFKWSDMMKNRVTSDRYTDPGYITLSGKIDLQGTKKPFSDKELLMLIITADSGKTVQMLRTDAEGRFHLDSMIFFDRARIVFSDIKGKRSKFIDVKLDGDSLHREYPVPDEKINDFLLPGTISPGLEKKMMQEYDAVIKAEGVMLQGVTVKGRKKTEQEELEEKYIRSGMFSGESGQTIDLANKKDETTGYQNIFDYLVFRVPGLQVVNEENSYSVFFRQGPSLSSMGPVPMAIFLDEVLQTDPNIIAAIPPDQIALVKVFSTFAGASGGGGGGALAIYMKKGSDYFASLPSAGEIINYGGYSVMKEFYSPDYTVDKRNTQPDHRITLYWNPTIFVHEVNAKIPVRFYNNDRTRQFKIVVEGMTTNGKMLMIEKTISGKKAF